jgi:hypothetical protein
MLKALSKVSPEQTATDHNLKLFTKTKEQELLTSMGNKSTTRLKELLFGFEHFPFKTSTNSKQLSVQECQRLITEHNINFKYVGQYQINEQVSVLTNSKFHEGIVLDSKVEPTYPTPVCKGKLYMNFIRCLCDLHFWHLTHNGAFPDILNVQPTYLGPRVVAIPGTHPFHKQVLGPGQVACRMEADECHESGHDCPAKHWTLVFLEDILEMASTLDKIFWPFAKAYDWHAAPKSEVQKWYEHGEAIAKKMTFTQCPPSKSRDDDYWVPKPLFVKEREAVKEAMRKQRDEAWWKAFRPQKQPEIKLSRAERAAIRRIS